MYGRREQVAAHSFLVGRILAAVLRTGPDAVDRPLRRTTVGMAGGIGTAIVVMAIVLIVALQPRHSGSRWTRPSWSRRSCRPVPCSTSPNKPHRPGNKEEVR